MRLIVCTCALFSVLTLGLLFIPGCSSENSRGPVATSPRASYDVAETAPSAKSAPTAEAMEEKATFDAPSPITTSPMAVSPKTAKKERPAARPAEEDFTGEDSSGTDSAGAKTAEPSPESSPEPSAVEDKKRKLEHRAAEEQRRQREIQAGLLTAGSFDDVQNYEAYQKFLTNTLQQDAGERFPRWAIGQFITVQVMADGGSPVGNAKIEIGEIANEQQQEQPPIRTLVTGSDGRAILLTGEDHLSGREKVFVRITAPGSEAVERIVKLDEPQWNFTLTNTSSKLPEQLDLALVVDTTGSMGDELEYLKVEIDSIATTVKQMFPQVNQRFALIVYRDDGDQYVTRTFDFTSSLADFRSTLSTQAAGGGGDYPEAMHLAMEHAGKLDWRKDNTARVMFLVGDAPPHQQYARRTLEAGLNLRQQGVRIYPLGASGVALEAEFIMRAVAFASAGQYLFLTDHSGIGNAHATPHVPEFQVERLDRLMIRMIAGELAGKRLAPTEVIAIERGEMHPSEGLPPEPIDDQPPQQVQPVSQGATLTPQQSAIAAFSDIPSWLIFIGILVSVLLTDVWEKHRRQQTT